MMRPQQYNVARPRGTSMATNAIIRKTYMLLSLTLIFSAAVAGYATISNAAPMNIILFIAGMFGLSFLTTSLRNSPWGMVSLFAFTGFMGYALGPILNFYIHGFTNGTQIVMTALGTTGVLFLGLSAYALTSKKDFSYLGGFISVAILLAFVLGLMAMFMNMPLLSLLVSGAFAVISCGYILYMTSQLINGGETNAIVATITLYIAIFNLFTTLLRLFGAFGGSRN